MEGSDMLCMHVCALWCGTPANIYLQIYVIFLDSCTADTPTASFADEKTRRCLSTGNRRSSQDWSEYLKPAFTRRRIDLESPQSTAIGFLTSFGCILQCYCFHTKVSNKPQSWSATLRLALNWHPCVCTNTQFKRGDVILRQGHEAACMYGRWFQIACCNHLGSSALNAYMCKICLDLDVFVPSTALAEAILGPMLTLYLAVFGSYRIWERSSFICRPTALYLWVSSINSFPAFFQVLRADFYVFSVYHAVFWTFFTSIVL